MKIEDVREILCKEHRWYEPKMQNKPCYLFDNMITTFAYIILRVDTGINMDNENVRDYFKVYAVNLKNKKGWIRTSTVSKEEDWPSNLLETCRKVWKCAYWRAKKEGCSKLHIDELLSN